MSIQYAKVRKFLYKTKSLINFSPYFCKKLVVCGNVLCRSYIIM